MLWQIARDLSEGSFYEPYFYGQNYNFPLESWIVAPLLKLGIPIWILFPLITSFLFLLPFFLLGYYFLKNKNTFGALICIGMPLLMQIEFNIISGLSRGFATGMFAAGFLAFFINQSKNRDFVLFGFFSVLALALNPNSVVFVAPLGFYYLLHNWTSLKFYPFLFLGALPPLAGKFLADKFYEDHPEYLLHTLWGNEFSIVALKDGFLEMSRIFQYSMPVIWNFDGLVLLILLASAIILFKQQKPKEAWSTLVAFVILIIALGIPKVHDDVGSIFLNTTRMWLALPLCMALVAGWLSQNRTIVKRQEYLLLIALASFFIYKQVNFRAVLDYETAKRNYGPVAIIPIEKLRDKCLEIKQLAEQHKVTLVALNPNWDYPIPELEMVAYGCSSLVEEFPRAIMGDYERRRWGHGDLYDYSHSKIMIVGWNPDKLKHVNYASTNKISESPRIYIMNLEKTETRAIFDLLNGTPID